jgi:IclR family KDG regulon transcriptional repressor
MQKPQGNASVATLRPDQRKGVGMTAASDTTGSVKSARRVLEILGLLGANPEGLRFPQIAEQLGLPKSSLHALLATLLSQGWVAFDETNRDYRIGVRAWEAGQGYVRARDLAIAADAHLHAARAELNETVQLGILDGVEVVYIAKVESDRPFRLVSRVGMRLPAWATGLGKVLLAWLPEDELRRRMSLVEFKAYTSNSIRSLDGLEKVLRSIRAEGVGRDNGEHTAFVYCVAAPVRDHTNEVVAAMSCTVPEPPPQQNATSDHLAEVLVRHATELSKSLGWNSGSAGRND